MSEKGGGGEAGAHVLFPRDPRIARQMANGGKGENESDDVLISHPGLKKANKALDLNGSRIKKLCLRFPVFSNCLPIISLDSWLPPPRKCCSPFFICLLFPAAGYLRAANV